MCVLQDVDFHPGESPARGRVGKVLYVRAPSHWAPLTLTSASHPLCFFVPLSHSLSPFTLSHALPPSPLLPCLLDQGFALRTKRAAAL